MPDDPRPAIERLAPAVVGERERERFVRLLGDHYANDQLSLEEYEFRVQAALRANQWYELVATTNDLPPLPNAGAPRIVRSDGESAAPRGRTLVALMGGFTRKGKWRVPARLRVLAVMGGVEIDLRDADLSASVTEIWALAVMGGVHIRVPPGVRLEVDGIAIMGGFSDQEGLPAIAPDDAPIVRVRGLAVMGGVGTEMKPRGWVDPDDDE